MATKPDVAEYLVNQLQSAGNVYSKRMFGEYGIYLDDKMLAMVCDNQLFVKPTKAGRAFLEEVEEGAPYPGAKLHFLITEDHWDDTDLLCELIRVTAPEVLPVKKKAKKL